MGEIGLPGDLEVRSITQIQIRERIAIDLGMVYRINSRCQCQCFPLAPSLTASEQFKFLSVFFDNLFTFFATVWFRTYCN